MKPLNEYDLYNKPFSIERHKQVPFAEMEVMISPDGEISYAVPSHQEFLIRKAMDANGWSRDELMDACPPKYYANFMQWLIDVSGANTSAMLFHGQRTRSSPNGSQTDSTQNTKPSGR